jgi:hypothetical protein
LSQRMMSFRSVPKQFVFSLCASYSLSRQSASNGRDLVNGKQRPKSTSW